ncbi:hypothetical protein C9374_012412 [Naegleria lovaniensis]|uniref:Uncharacterized protein n=1 Tax=Naegleria lovaniensis TaxID=51637 RepID=A0AA88GZP0_NAELO|nr:uncharacterized protein C9374_012412 [Naegleria lovaniensis]KAG2392160.1 hypothetical protein C9374_012412 [Naegleria lovaniensis]
MLQPQHSGNCSPPTTTTPRDSSNELGHWPTTPSSSGLNQPNNIPNIFDSNKIHNADKGYHFLNSELYNRNNNNSNSDNNLLCTVFTTQNSQYQDQLVPVSIFLPFTLRSVPLEIISFGEIVESKPSNYESSNAATNSARELFHQVEKFWRKFKGEFVHPYPIGFQAILRLRRRRRVKKSPEADWISDTAIERIQLKLEIIKGEVGPQFVVTDISSSKGVGQRFVGSSCSHPFTEAFQLYQPDEVPDTNENGEIIEYSYLDVDTDELTGLSAFGFCDLYFQSILNSIAKQAHRYLPDQINIFDGRSKEFWKTTLEREKQKLMMEIVELEKKKQVLMKLSTTKPSTRDSSNPVTTKPRRVVKKRTKRPVMDVEDTPSFADGEDSLKEAVSDSEPSQQQISPNNIGSASSIVSPIKKIKMDGTATEEVSTPNRIEAVFPTTNNNAMDLQNDLEIGPSSSSMHDDLELRLLKGSPHPPSSNHQSPIKPSNMQQSQPTIEKRNTVSQESIAEDSDKEDQHVHVTPTRMSLVNMPNSPKLEKINISPAKRNPISLELKDAVDIMEVSKEKETSIQQSSLSLTPPSHQQQHVQSNSPEFAIPALPSLQPLKKNASQTQQSQHSIETASVPQTSQPQASISQHHDDNTSKPKSQSEEVVIKPGSTITQDSPQLDEIIDEDGERDGDTMNGVSVTKDGDISRELAQKHDEMVTEDGHDIQNSKPQKSDIITVNPAAEVKETEIVQVLFDTTSATVKPQTDDKHMDDTTTLSTTTLMQNQQGKNPNITNEVDDDATPTDIILETDQFSNSIKERVETKLSPQLAEEISNASHSMQTANQETTSEIVSKIESTSHQEINMVTTTTADQTTTTLTNVSHAFMPILEVQFSGEMPSPSSANSNNSTGTTHFEAATGQEVASVKISTAGVASGMITNDHSDEETPKDLTPPVQVFEDTSKNFNPLVNDTPSKTKAKTEITMHNDEEIPATPTPAKPLLTDASSPARTELATPTYEHTPAMDMSSKTIIPATIVLDPLELGGEDDMVDDDFDSNDEDDKQPISTPPNNTSRILSYTTPRSERGEDGASISSQAAVEETQYPAIKIDLDLGQLSPSKKNNPFMQAPVCENEQSESDEEQESPKTPSPTALGLNIQFSSPPLINTISPIVKTSVTSPIVFNNNNSKALDSFLNQPCK